jgi:hypothetical protein
VGFSAFSLASPVACLHYALRKRAGKTVMLLRNNQITAQLDPGPGTVSSLHPVAIGAAVEATKPLKPPVERVASGDLASLQVVTRVSWAMNS